MYNLYFSKHTHVFTTLSSVVLLVKEKKNYYIFQNIFFVAECVKKTKIYADLECTNQRKKIIKFF